MENLSRGQQSLVEQRLEGEEGREEQTKGERDHSQVLEVEVEVEEEELEVEVVEEVEAEEEDLGVLEVRSLDQARLPVLGEMLSPALEPVRN